ncbi:MAG: hypothetical protein ABIN97_14700 [Ginsengibacter sp.]
MENLPLYISLVFGLTTCLTVFLFYKATNNSIRFIIIISLWLIVQTIISVQGFYTVSKGMPPRFLLLILPPIILIATLFLTTRGRQFIDSLNLKALTLLHIIRVPVEVVLFCLFLNKAVPELMTFEGRNFDIVSGLTAPFIFYFGFIKKTLGKKIILLWNFICLGLLINIVIIAILSAPLSIQKFAFDQPNRALLYFPFIWLPCCIVPLVLFSHLASIRQLLRQVNNNQ